MRTEARLTLKGWTKAFGTVPVLRGLDLDVAPGEWLTLLGPSGCGKTTVLRCLAGLERLDSGSAVLGDLDLLALPPQRRPLHTVFQHYALFPHLDVFENVAFGLRVRRAATAEIAERVNAALARVRLEGLGHRAVDRLSGGQQQRVALARALVLEPRVLLLDEPLGALDAALRREMQLELKRLQQAIGCTCILVTHDQEEALRVSDRIALMRAGRIEQCAAPRTLYDAPASPFAARFLGLAGFLPVAADRSGVSWRLRHADVTWEGTPRIAPVGDSPAGIEGTAPLSAGKALALCLRPEEWRILDEVDGRAGPTFAAIVRSAAFQGETWRIFAVLESGHGIEIALPASEAGSRSEAWSSGMPGQAIRVGFAPGAGVLMEAP